MLPKRVNFDVADGTLMLKTKGCFDLSPITGLSKFLLSPHETKNEYKI